MSILLANKDNKMRTMLREALTKNDTLIHSKRVKCVFSHRSIEQVLTWLLLKNELHQWYELNFPNINIYAIDSAFILINSRI